VKLTEASLLRRWERPLASGIAITVAGRAGTLGALVRDRLTGAQLLLGTAHVMMPRDSFGAAVWQPAPCGQHGCACNRVGETVRAVSAVVAWNGHHYYLDAAVAVLETDVEAAPSNFPEICAADRGVRVWKHGAATGRTTGVVLDHRHVETAMLWNGNRHAPNQILIRSLPGNAGPDGVGRFAAAGDSGALVFDEKDRVVGLLWGASRSGEAVACHIGPLLDSLAIDIEVRT